MIYLKFFDLHCDTPYECYVKKQEFYKNNLSVSGEKGECFSKWYQTFAVWMKDNTEKPYEKYKSILNDFKSKLIHKPDNLYPIFSVESGAVLETDKERLYSLKQDGIKILTLTWNGENNIAGGCKTDKGLTNFGKEVIDIMNKLNIACDLSHINDKSFFKAIEIADFPIASHSNCRSLCHHPRNITDTQIKLIAEKSGIIGICPYPEFLSGDIIDSIYQNIYHICDLGFENSIAFGSDFDGAKQDEKLSDISKIPFLRQELEKKGLKNSLLDKIFYKNAYNYIAKL